MIRCGTLNMTAAKVIDRRRRLICVGVFFFLPFSPHAAHAAMDPVDRARVPPPGATFYRRPLPETAVSFSSRAGRAVFASALRRGGAHAFFPLIEQL